MMKPRILIADDNPHIRGLLNTLLFSFGYDVTVAADGLAAWEEVRREPPSLVVLDIEMPFLDGCEVCRRIKSQQEMQGIPVMLVSSHPDTAYLAQDAGADDFLNKPFELDEMQRRIDSLLRQRVPEQAGITANG